MTRRRAQVLVGSPLAPDGGSVDSAECARNHYCSLFFRLYLRNNLLVHFLCFFSPEHNGGNPKKKKKKLKKMADFTNGVMRSWSNQIISYHPPRTHKPGPRPAPPRIGTAASRLGCHQALLRWLPVRARA
jgi:hypothetical protein